MRSSKPPLAIGLATALLLLAAPAAIANHQQVVTLWGFGSTALGVVAPTGWVCTAPFQVGVTWGTDCTILSATSCAEPETDVSVTGAPIPVAGVLGTTQCDVVPPSSTLSSGCLALMWGAMTSDTCNGQQPGYISGSWVTMECRATPGGTVLNAWKVHCGIII